MLKSINFSIACLLSTHFFAQSNLRDDYFHFFQSQEFYQDALHANKILILNFDICGTGNNRCSDSTWIRGQIEKLKPNDLLIIDTLYNSVLPWKIDFSNLFFVNREKMQRAGVSSAYYVIVRRNKRKIKKLK